MTDPTCAERIGDHLARRLAHLANLNRGVPSSDYLSDPAATTDELAEAAQDELNELPLAVSLERVVRVDLSTGGPADWLELFYRSDDDEPHRVVYHFADWFDHAEVTLSGDEADEVAQAFGWFAEVNR